MPRPARRSAGVDIRALAGRLSDRLLVEETRAFAEIDLAFMDGLTRAVVGFQSHPTVTMLVSPAFADRFERDTRRALLATVEAVERLVDRSVAAAVRSILKELTICEEAGPRRARGTAMKGATEAGQDREALVRDALASYQEGFDTVAAAARIQALEQVGIVIARSESRAQLQDRLFSPTPLGVIGNGGRGVWWRTPATLKAMARARSIDAVNVTRLTAMRGMNAAANP